MSSLDLEVELQEYGISMKDFFKKLECVRALAEACVEDQWVLREENEIEEAEVLIEDHESQLELMTLLELKAKL
eukprot:9872479-Ditylum_brightwellii.AAC.1